MGKSDQHNQPAQASRQPPSAGEQRHRHQIGPSLEEMRDVLLAVLPQVNGDIDPADSVQINLSMVQARQLTSLLGWRPTPTTEDCSDHDGRLRCPNCSAVDNLRYRIQSWAEQPARETVAVRQLRLPDPDSGWNQTIDWWFRCRQCGIDFNPPADGDTDRS